LKQRVIVTWGSVPQSIIDEAVDQWRAQLPCMREGEGASLCTSAVNNRFFSEPPDHKTGFSEPAEEKQSTEENALHFTCLACSSVQGSVGTQQYS